MPSSCLKPRFLPVASSFKMTFRPCGCSSRLRAARGSVAGSNSVRGKIVGSGWKKIVVPVPRAGPSFLSSPVRLALLELHLPLGAVALDGGDELLRQRVDDGGADAVQAAGRLVVAAASRICRRRGACVKMISSAVFLCFGCLSTGMPRPLSPTVMRRAVLVQRDLDLRRRGRSSPRRRSCRRFPRRGGAGRPSRRRRCTCRGACGRARGLRGR